MTREMTNPKRKRPAVTVTLEPEVLDAVDDYAKGLGMDRSTFINLQIKLSLNMVDEETRNVMAKGLPMQVRKS